MLEKLLNSDGGDYKGRTIPGDNGGVFEFVEYRNKKVVTVLGEVWVKRAYYYDSKGRTGMSPKDKALDIEGVSLSPGLRRIMARAGAYRPFVLGHEDIREMTGISVTAKEVERVSHTIGEEAERFFSEEAALALSESVISIKAVPVPMMYVCMDGTGVPVEKKETADEFSDRIYAEAKRRGMDRAGKVCVIGDGAPWIWNIAEEQFHGAIQIVDLYHAREHYWNVARMAFGGDAAKINQWCRTRKEELDSGKVEEVIVAILMHS
ncbi:MAG: hypothetical protein HY786_03765 [Deltaproteobacteria bacterium]|nr:hypothetical protein [Deltaproteobacteria bacterium]